MFFQTIQVKLPVTTSGTSVGVRNGGRLHLVYRRLPVVGLADSIPESISVDISPLEIGDSIRVADITVEGCTVPLNDSAVVLGVRRTRAAMSAAAGEDGEGGEGGEAEGGEEAAAAEE